MTPGQQDSGVYLLVLDVRSAFAGNVGCLGHLSLGKGSYGYAGSARRGLNARLMRHRRRGKPLRWHIDSLTAVADLVGAIVWPWRNDRECRLAAALTTTGLGRLAANRFGASDCRCAGHLFALRDTDLGIIEETLTLALGAQGAQIMRFPEAKRARK